MRCIMGSLYACIDEVFNPPIIRSCRAGTTTSRMPKSYLMSATISTSLR